MPTHKSAKKRLKTNEKSNVRNRAVKSRIRSLVKNAETSVDEASLKEAVSLLDRAARKKVIHPNKASRMKSRLAKAVQKKAAPAAT
ncbi:MAG: 30S ribosomal protein S20 [Candidatus Zixiibacteriota bacterium]|nr:MAG: 30S ribosomal protein S20 [candidate division Zixibacteria bacterium]